MAGKKAKNKKLVLGFIALAIAIAIIVLVIVFSKINPSGEILLKDGITLPQEICSNLSNVTIIHQAGCSACVIALPRLRELEQELNLNFKYYDLAIENERQEVLNFGVTPQAVPTTIIYCKVYVGVRSKEEYKDIIMQKTPV